jgi:3-isopropylmalate/(R)-2-methylmalate dehydratase small subunit
MAGWDTHAGQAVALPLENVDTDQLIPARFMSQPRDAGYGGFLLHDLRRGPDGAPDPDFVLNRHTGASVLVAGRNFGSGSSREAAVYALVDAGFRAVIAPSFGDIFAGNAVNNGLLAAQLPDDQIAKVMAKMGEGTVPARVDLRAGAITLGEMTFPFQLDETWRKKLINGWDDIDMTASHDAEIAAYCKAISPWRWPASN